MPYSFEEEVRLQVTRPIFQISIHPHPTWRHSRYHLHTFKSTYWLYTAVWYSHVCKVVHIVRRRYIGGGGEMTSIQTYRQWFRPRPVTRSTASGIRGGGQKGKMIKWYSLIQSSEETAPPKLGTTNVNKQSLLFVSDFYICTNMYIFLLEEKEGGGNSRPWPLYTLPPSMGEKKSKHALSPGTF